MRERAVRSRRFWKYAGIHEAMVALLSRIKTRAQPSMLVVSIFMLRYADNNSRGTWGERVCPNESVMRHCFVLGLAVGLTRRVGDASVFVAALFAACT
jgi:hypothetical protein